MVLSRIINEYNSLIIITYTMLWCNTVIKQKIIFFATYYKNEKIIINRQEIFDDNNMNWQNFAEKVCQFLKKVSYVILTEC